MVIVLDSSGISNISSRRRLMTLQSWQPHLQMVKRTQVDQGCQAHTGGRDTCNVSPCEGVFQVCYQLLGVIEIILKVNFDHSEESHAREEGARPRLKNGKILSLHFVHDEIWNSTLVSITVEGR